MNTLEDVAPPAGAWIETLKEEEARVKAAVAPPAGAWIETVVQSISVKKRIGRSPRGSVD